MKQIIIGDTGIGIESLTPYVYDSGKGEKVLRIVVSAEHIGFGALRDVLENNAEPIQYMEDDKLVCEYVGYGTFEAQYKDGKYSVELHKASIGEQMSALLVANERLVEAQTALELANAQKDETITLLAMQNEMHQTALSEILEVVIPNFLGEIMATVQLLDARVTALESEEELVVEEVIEEEGKEE